MTTFEGFIRNNWKSVISGVAVFGGVLVVLFISSGSSDDRLTIGKEVVAIAANLETELQPSSHEFWDLVTLELQEAYDYELKLAETKYDNGDEAYVVLASGNGNKFKWKIQPDDEYKFLVYEELDENRYIWILPGKVFKARGSNLKP